MKVILTKDVASLGDVGDVVPVKSGYARNYLLPRQMAVVANESNRREVEHYKRQLTKKKEEMLAGLRSVAKKIERLKIKVSKQAGEEDRIFGSVTTVEVAALLLENGIEIDRKIIELPEMKKLGSYQVAVNLHKEVSATLKLKLVSQEA